MTVLVGHVLDEGGHLRGRIEPQHQNLADLRYTGTNQSIKAAMLKTRYVEPEHKNLADLRHTGTIKSSLTSYLYIYRCKYLSIQL